MGFKYLCDKSRIESLKTDERYKAALKYLIQEKLRTDGYFNIRNFLKRAQDFSNGKVKKNLGDYLQNNYSINVNVDNDKWDKILNILLENTYFASAKNDDSVANGKDCWEEAMWVLFAYDKLYKSGEKSSEENNEDDRMDAEALQVFKNELSNALIEEINKFTRKLEDEKLSKILAKKWSKEITSVIFDETTEDLNQLLLKNLSKRTQNQLEREGMCAILDNIFGSLKYDTGTHIVYNPDKVEIKVINNINDLLKRITEPETGKRIFFRGHADSNYSLIPTLFRKQYWNQCESKMYHELVVECPDSFSGCKDYVDHLVEMQHYGLPTRLLDITENPLVALYFVCSSDSNLDGELLLFKRDDDSIVYTGSREVRELSNLLEEAKNYENYNHIFLVASKKNRRIVKQNGAFILFCKELSYYTGDIVNDIRMVNENGKFEVYIISNKKKSKILKELELMNITQASLFPEIDKVAEYIKKKYNG